MTAPVDTFLPNPWGLYNVHGNVFDWTQDCYNFSNIGNPGDGSARFAFCTSHMLRGGSWSSDPALLRAAWRYHINTVTRLRDVGFRVARSLDQ
jgi:formylglycine-generating enzyme required for sulfatase activity